MTGSSPPRFGHRIAAPIGALIGVYAVLIVLAAACPLDPMPAQPGHHHHNTSHHDKGAHTVLCAWACQASFSVLTSDGHTSTPSLLLILLLAGWFHRSALSLHGLIQSRAPPVLHSR